MNIPLPEWRRYDPILGIIALLLLTLGLVMVASASVSIAADVFGDPLAVFKRQGVFAIIGIAAAFAATQLPMMYWQRCSLWLLLAGFVLLVLVLIPGIGIEVNGSARWIHLAGLNGQPSELVKLLVIVYLADYLVRHSQTVRQSAAAFIYPMIMLAAISALLIAEPDFGTTVILIATATGMLFLGGVPVICFIVGMIAILALLVGVVILEPYRVDRLMVFADPFIDPYDKGFQLVQALIAVGRGGWFGVGLGESIQKLLYLPEAYTDFLFAVLAEELGLFGVIVVIGLFLALIGRGFSIARQAQRNGNWFNVYVAYGIVLLLGLQAFINIGVNLGILPTKGLTLPLMSYGGSSLVTSCLMIGILLRIDYETNLHTQQRSWQ